MKHCLTIAGSDSGGGAGIQADLKTFSALGSYGMSVITAITAQNTEEVTGIAQVSPEIIYRQLQAVYADIRIDAIKIGMVDSGDIINVIGKCLREWHMEKIVLDPVMVTTGGHSLLQDAAELILLENLFPLSLIVTPNLHEAEVIVGHKLKTVTNIKEAARQILQLGPASVVITGGHLQSKAIDIFYDGKEFHEFTVPKINCIVHGSGCTFSSAITAFLAQGYHLITAVKKAKKYVTGAIKHRLKIGAGAAPLNHFYQFNK